MHLALIYDLVDDYLDRRPPLREEHLAMAQEAHARGDLAMAGAFNEPPDTALLVWSTEDEDVVRRFAEADPYVLNGLVTSWQIRKWNVVIG
jgi:uncharacterized protein YciI